MSIETSQDSDKSGAPRTFGVTSIDVLRSMSGLDFITAILEGRLPAPPISETLDFAMTEAEAGRVVFVGHPKLHHYNPLGSTHGGWAATLMDSCMSCAVQTTLPQGSGYTTVEFKVNLLRPITEATGPVTAEGRVVQSGRRVGVAEGRLTDRAGKLLAHGSATCLIFEL